jgi:hypothetical protein
MNDTGKILDYGHEHRCSIVAILDGDGQKSKIIDNNDYYFLQKLKTRKICSIESVKRVLKFVK